MRIQAADGFELAATVYEPDTSPRGVVVINSATAVRRRYYERFARYLGGHAFVVATYDYRGVGESAPTRLRGFAATLREWGERDQEAVLTHVRRAYPGVPLLIVGHSIGGQIVGLLRDHASVAGVLGVAAQHNYWRLWGMPHRYALWALWHLLMPATSRALGYFPGSRLGLGEDLPRDIALDWARWCRSPGALVEAVGGDAPTRFASYRGPLLALSFADDTFFAPRRAVDGLVRLYPNAEGEHRHIRPTDHGLRAIGHFGYFRESVGATLWPAAVDWLLSAAARQERFAG